jgi:hypothetical protein
LALDLSQKQGQESSSCSDDEPNRSNHWCECQVDSRENLGRSLLYERHKHFALKCRRSAVQQSSCIVVCLGTVIVYLALRLCVGASTVGVTSYRCVSSGTTIVHLALRGSLNRGCNELSMRLLGNNNRAPCSAREPQLWVQRSIYLHLLGNNNIHVRVEVLYSSNLIEAKYAFTSTFQNLKSQRANGQPRLLHAQPFRSLEWCAYQNVQQSLH